ncbi:hypothetical protein DFP72DRAFT_522318 [Ephemerocybe angulata]|uniref:DUF6533 domain-containing protein n=1 Tax=Ephemerocybe angulata TaxID=980116 RepID=A0A8H6MBG9_9AGAR|nr:hypothetical protein DFP72DRAFT_522318 [Tulosesus angulatus]
MQAVVAYTFATLDFVQTFPEEVRLMWGAPFGLPKVLFFAVRYSVLVNDVFCGLAGGFPTEYADKDCLGAWKRSAMTSVFIVVAAEAILFHRAYAFSGKRTGILVYIVAQFIAIHAAAFILMLKFFESSKFTKWDVSNIRICLQTQGSVTLLAGVFASFLASITVAMSIMVYAAIYEHREFNTRSPLLVTFYRDGIFYFISLAAFASVNIVIIWIAPAGYKFLLTQ